MTRCMNDLKSSQDIQSVSIFETYINRHRFKVAMTQDPFLNIRGFRFMCINFGFTHIHYVFQLTYMVCVSMGYDNVFDVVNFKSKTLHAGSDHGEGPGRPRIKKCQTHPVYNHNWLIHRIACMMKLGSCSSR